MSTPTQPQTTIPLNDGNQVDQQESSSSSVITPSEPDFKFYRPSSVNPGPSATPLPDNYFTPTASDLKAAQATLSARTQALVDAPLQLRATREASEKAKQDRWPNTTIRIRFTDRSQLEKVFPSTVKIRTVYAFVRGCLREDVKPIKFILYQSPPKRDLKVSDPKVRDLTLAELSLAPSSILLLRFEDDALNGSDIPAPVLPSILAQTLDLPTPPDLDNIPPPQGDKRPSSSSNPNSKAQPDPKKIFNALKLGFKRK